MESQVISKHLLPMPSTLGEEEVVAGVRARELAAALAAGIEGEVRFDRGARALYATDGSNYRETPIGVVVPRTLDDVVRTVALCREFDAPLLSRGGGTSLAGQCCNVAVVMDFTKYLNRVLTLDPDGRRATVQPGCVLDTLRQDANRHGLTFGPDPATHTHNVLGGMIGNNSCGIHSVLAALYGPGARTSDNLHELEVLLYDGTRMRVGATGEEELERIIAEGGRRGEIYAGMKAIRDRYGQLIRERYPDIPRRVSGYNLDELLPEKGFNVARALAGTEGTCVVYLEATLELVWHPTHSSLVVLGFPGAPEAADHVTELMEHRPIGLEALDERLVHDMEVKGLHTRDVGVLPPGKAWLLVEFGADTAAEADDRAKAFVAAIQGNVGESSVKHFRDPKETERIWEVREAGLGATAFVPGEPDTWTGWEDSAVHPSRMGDYLRDLRDLMDRHGLDGAFYGHFGQGLVHTRMDFGLKTAAQVETYRSFTQAAAELVTQKYDGTLSGEHGDGQSRGDLLPIMYGDELVRAFEEFKALWDPGDRMNPGKVVRPRPRTAELRLGTRYNPWNPQTVFQLPDDRGSLARAALRCVGVGKCRRNDGGTMCPSYMVTHEEAHATRGRAHLLFEMLRGETITDGWKSEAVRDALHLCLACKGCKGDCPVNVDIATYKAEFLSHYYAGRLRPRQAYAFGLIQWWARAAEHMPSLANFLTGTPVLSGIAHWLSGAAPERTIPQFAAETFRHWWRRRPPVNEDGPAVLLWPDTFNDHFFPAVLEAGAQVLERAGFHVMVPEQWLCCGRPLFDYGMLNLARWQLRQILRGLREPIRRGIPLVGLEPGCLSVFRDELVNFFPRDEDACRLHDQSFTLAELLQRHAAGYRPPRLERQAILHGHCHHKSILGLGPEMKLLHDMGLTIEEPETGCCGLAGSFGFEHGEKYRISVAAAERVLLTAVRQATDNTLIIADGFSCREQIRQLSGRRALHLAEVLQMAMEADRLPPGARPEAQQAALRPPELARTGSPLAGAAALGGALLLGGAVVGGAVHFLGNGRNGRRQLAPRTRQATPGGGRERRSRHKEARARRR